MGILNILKTDSLTLGTTEPSHRAFSFTSQCIPTLYSPSSWPGIRRISSSCCSQSSININLVLSADEAPKYWPHCFFKSVPAAIFL